MNTGDLIFSFIGRVDNPISAVTRGYKGARVNHMGVIVTTARGIFVLEAYPPEVRLTQVDVFKRRSAPHGNDPRVMMARLQPQYEGLIIPAVDYGIARRNTPYDDLYLTDESFLYCSELVVDMFKYANGGAEFFKEIPMSFRDPATGEIHPAWQEYYDRFGLSVPQGQPGSNPGDISLDPRIQFYHVEGSIPGLSD